MRYLPFANDHVWELSEPNDLVHHIQEQICHFWGCSFTNRFLGPQPVSIERKHIPQLKSNRYLATEKTDGERYLLVCVEDVKQGYTVLVNRKNQMFLVDATLQVDVCKGSVLDGELIQIGSRYEFLVFDCVAAFGTSRVAAPFEERLQSAASVVSNIRCKLMNMKIKEFVELSDLERYMTETIPKLSHNMDGLIFTPCELPIGTGTQFSMFKWKPRFKNTVDFSLHAKQHNGNGLYSGKILKTRKNGSYLMTLQRVYIHVNNELHDTIQSSKDDVIVECENTNLYPDERWKALFVRKDKSYPNSMLTYSRTKVNIEENIEPGEFYQG